MTMTPHPNLAICVLLAVAGCVTKQDLGEPPSTEGSAASGTSEGSSSTATSGEASTSGAETGSESGSPQTGSSESGVAQECILRDEGIAIAQLENLDEGFGQIAPCEVTDDGLVCQFSTGPELVDLDPVLGGLIEPPWQLGETLDFFAEGPSGSAYSAQVTIRNLDGTLLAMLLWNLNYVPEPFELQLDDIGCEDPDSSSIPLQATYSLEGETVTLLGSESVELGDYAIFQEGAADYSQVSAGELGVAVTYAIVRRP